jgi:hypothetical protein
MQITWFGHSAFRLDFASHVVLIDPFFTGNPAFVTDKGAAIEGVTHIVLATMSETPSRSPRRPAPPWWPITTSACGSPARACGNSIR